MSTQQRRTGAVIDGWRLASGTLTALPSRPPQLVDAASARWCVLLAPAAVLPLAAAVAVVGALTLWLGAPPLVGGFLAVGALALGTRVLHTDGLSDTVDGLTASYDPARSLEVMKTGTSGPAGTLATVVVAGLQAAALSALFTSWTGVAAAGAAVVASRGALAWTCRQGVPAARRNGLGHPLAGVVSTGSALSLWTLLAALLVAANLGSGAILPAALTALGAAVAAVLVVLALVRHTVRRFTGVTGDVYGAGVEAAFTTLVVVLAL